MKFGNVFSYEVDKVLHVFFFEINHWQIISKSIEPDVNCLWAIARHRNSPRYPWARPTDRKIRSMILQIIQNFILCRCRHYVALSLHPFSNSVNDITFELKDIVFFLNFSYFFAHLSFIKWALVIPYQVFLHHKAFLIHWVVPCVLSLRYETFILEDIPHFWNILFMGLLGGPYESVVAYVWLLEQKFKPRRVGIAETLSAGVRQFCFLLHFLTMLVGSDREEGGLAQ